jgi:hypothetical protein
MSTNVALKLKSAVFLMEAKRRRAMGYYTPRTLSVYSKAWQASLEPKALFHFCLFRHELGYRLPKYLDSLLGRVTDQLKPYDCAVAHALLSPRRRAEQAILRQHFAFWLGATPDQSIAVVGNSAELLGKGKASAIERFGRIVRFNHWRAPAEDVGERTDLWVRSPLDIKSGCSPIPAPPPSWIAVSGPEMSSRRPEWDNWEQSSSARMTSVPLHVWRGLVRILGAPPSAGLLTLAWLRSIRGSWYGIEVFGVGYGGGRYHAAKKNHHPSRRHDWKKETRVIEQWRVEGLKIN